jgi:hypothetical protein
VCARQAGLQADIKRESIVRWGVDLCSLMTESGSRSPPRVPGTSKSCQCPEAQIPHL